MQISDSEDNDLLNYDEEDYYLPRSSTKFSLFQKWFGV